MKPKEPQLVSSSSSTRLKGLHTKNLIARWHDLLHIRVKLQNILDIVNVLPVGHLEAIESPELKEHASRVLSDARVLAGQYTVRVLGLPAAVDTASVDSAGGGSAAALLEARLEERQRGLLAWHEPVLADWHERASLGGSGGGGLSRMAQHPVQRLQALLADRDRLLSRSRLNRSRLRPLRLPGDDGDCGDVDKDTAEPPESYPSLYDDSDLYKLVLLDFVHCRTAGIADPTALGREFARLQQLRRRLRKRAVDTRASKARRLRYLEMPKLVNFAAAAEPPGQLTEAQRRELYASLFGRLVTASQQQQQQQQH